MNLIVKLCSAEEIIPIRHEVLRAGRPVSSCHFDGDNNSKTFHFGAYKGEKISGCVSLMFKNHPAISSQKSYQLRGMAVLKDFQNQSIGLSLLQQAEKHLKGIGIELIWCNVRINAIGFYHRQGYQSKGKRFTIPDVGPHVLMHKYLADA